jgi:hypothetical protein
MAQDFAKISNVGGYTPYRIHAAQAETIIDTGHSHGTFLGTLVVGTQGTTDVITLSNGSGNPFLVLTHPPVGSYEFNCKLNSALYVTVTGTAGDYCFNAIPMAI